MDADTLDPTGFAPADRAEWLALATKALKDASFDEALVSRTDDGIAIQPLYGRLSGAAPVNAGRADRKWVISQRVDDPDTERALSQLGDDLDNGAAGIGIVSRGAASAFGLGIEASCEQRLLEGLGHRVVSVRLEGSAPLPAIVDGRHPGTERTVHWGLDPFSPAALAGVAVGLEELPARYAAAASAGLPGTLLNAEGRLIHNAGGSEAQELAVVAAAIAGYVRCLEAHGPAAVLGSISLCLAASQEQFLTTAKARAARLIFARIAEACGVDPAPRAHVFMETSYRMLTQRDPETSILRNTIAVFAAATGGADEISVLPHTLPHGIPDPLARRLARNTQWILMAESHLDHVADPAAGSGGIEALTDALAEKAWGIFGEIERQGGLAAITGSGVLADMIARTRNARVARPIVGTTLYAATEERAVTVSGPLAPVAGSGLRPVRSDEEVGA